MDELPDKALDWVPGPNMNSVAVIITHLTGAERYWIADIVARDSSHRVREREFQVRNLSTANLKARLDESLDYIRAVLPTLTVAGIDQLRSLPDHDASYTVGWCLLHALEHTAVHTGHVELMRQLWEEQG